MAESDDAARTMRTAPANTPGRVFLISPIGSEGSLPRAESDRVVAEMIQPALDQLKSQNGIEMTCVRGDKLGKPGDLIREIVRNIVESDVVIALIFNSNENVFYELGVAHSAGRPVIVLKSDSFKRMPSDVQMQKYLEYEGGFDHTKGYSGNRGDFPELLRKIQEANIDFPRHSAALALAIKDCLDADPVDRPFGEFPATAALGRRAVLDRFNEVKMEEWSQTIMDARQSVWLTDIALNYWAQGQKMFYMQDEAGDWSIRAELKDLLATLSLRGVDVNLMMMHEENESLGHLLRTTVEAESEAAHQKALKRTRRDIADATEYWMEVADDVAATPRPSAELGTARGAFRVVKVRKGVVPARMTWTDRVVYSTPFFYTFEFQSGPTLSAAAGVLWHSEVEKDLNFLAALNPPEPAKPPIRKVG